MSSLGPWFGGGGRNRGGYDYFGSPFSISDVWDPFDIGSNQHFWDLSRRRGRGGGDSDDTASVIAHTNVDWRETDNAHIFRADLPGVKKEEVKVQVEDGNILEISGEHTKEERDANDKWHRFERQRGSFSRRFRLPENAKVDDIKCTMENGILTVTVPKTETEVAPKNVRSIDIA